MSVSPSPALGLLLSLLTACPCPVEEQHRPGRAHPYRGTDFPAPTPTEHESILLNLLPRKATQPVSSLQEKEKHKNMQRGEKWVLYLLFHHPGNTKKANLS